MGKLVEGLWDCPFCDNKRIRAGQKTCPNCGHPQDENTKFYKKNNGEKAHGFNRGMKAA